MYKKYDNQPITGNLPLFFDNTLNKNNRWVKLAGVIPWEFIDELYAKKFKSISTRVAFGSLLIPELSNPIQLNASFFDVL